MLVINLVLMLSALARSVRDFAQQSWDERAINPPSVSPAPQQVYSKIPAVTVRTKKRDSCQWTTASGYFVICAGDVLANQLWARLLSDLGAT